MDKLTDDLKKTLDPELGHTPKINIEKKKIHIEKKIGELRQAEITRKNELTEANKTIALLRMDFSTNCTLIGELQNEIQDLNGREEKLKVLNIKKEAYILPDTAITEFAQKVAKETNTEKIEAILMEFVQEHFQFRI